MKYSFIIPMYNEEKDIILTVECCKKQICTNFEMEIILIDDCSIDSTYDICREKYSFDPLITLLLNSENKGVSYSRNKGVNACNGDILIFLNADELIENDFLCRIDKHYKNNADYVFPQSRVKNIDSAYGKYRDCYRLSKYNSPSKFMWSQGFSCRKSLYYEIGGFSELYPGCGGEDWDFVSKIDLISKNRVVDLNIVVKHVVETNLNKVLWHMYNRGRGTAYNDLIYHKKNSINHVIKLTAIILLLQLILIFNQSIFIGIILAKFMKIFKIGFEICKVEKNGKLVVFIMFLMDSLIRFIGYNLTMIKNLGK